MGKEILPKVEFSPAGRKLEHRLVREARRAINKMDIPEEEKTEMKDMWFDYLLEYEKEYKKYCQAFKKYNLPPPNSM